MHRKAIIITIILVVVCAGVVVLLQAKRWKVFGQAAPARFEAHMYASYQFNVLKRPTGLALVHDPIYNMITFYIADSGNHVIRRFTPQMSGQLHTAAGVLGSPGYVNGDPTNAKFNFPAGLVVKSTQTVAVNPYNQVPYPVYVHSVYVNDSQNFVLRAIHVWGGPYGPWGQFTPSVVTAAGSTKGMVDGPSLSASFASLAGLTKVGNDFYIADAENQVIRKWDGTNVTTVAGSGVPGESDGNQSTAQFFIPGKVAFDNDGNMYIADVENYVIRKMDTSGYVSTIAGQKRDPGSGFSKKGAKFYRPTSIVFNPADNMFYIADSHNNMIRRMDLDGNVSDYAGVPEEPGLVNGTLEQARFSTPMDLVIYNGVMYVSDMANNVIRRIDMTSGIVSTYIS